MAKNEYLITPYVGGKAVGDTVYVRTGHKDALILARSWLDAGKADEVDMQVIYDYENPESEIADVWWSIVLGDYTPPATHKRLFITKH